MKVFKITGKVVRSNTKEGIKDLRVEAWDKDLLVNDLVGSAITTEGGVFRIQFDETYFKELFLDHRPDLFFKIYKGSRLIKTTENSVLWNVDRDDIEMTIEVENNEDTTTSETAASKHATTRSVLQATYTPRKPRAGEDLSKTPRALEKAAFFAQLVSTREELDTAAEKYEKATKNKSAKVSTGATKALKGIKAISKTISVTGKLNVLRDCNVFADMETAVLVNIAQDLIKGRKDTLSVCEIEHQYNLLQVFKENMSVECVGYLHLERMNYTPSGIERGELVYSVPLSPVEEVNIKHREWSHITEEFERIITDYLEEFSEEGVTEKTELAQTVNSQEQHSSAFNTGVTASGSYGPISITTTAGYNASDSSSKSTQLTRNHNADITHKASSRAKKEHKISFRVASAVETENESVQRIKNPFSDKATRVDYYQLIRKWQIDLLRYGMRLTWDMVIPEPGEGLLTKVRQIRRIKQELSVPFEEIFNLDPKDITLDNYLEKAAEYGVPLDIDVPEKTKTLSTTFEGRWGFEQEVCKDGPPHFSQLIELDEIPEGYEIVGDEDTNFIIWVRRCPEFPPHSQGRWSITVHDMVTRRNIYKEDSLEHIEYTANVHWQYWKGHAGKLAIHIFTWRVHSMVLRIEVKATISDTFLQSWKNKVWKCIRDGARINHDEGHRVLEEQLARIEEELGAQDALSLRKKEREEVMKGVLEAFGLSPSEENNRDPRIIRFIHHALEWENILYFLYPYFWSNPDKKIDSDVEQEHPYWEFKKYLDHPDPMHRAFLKAGAARVVLPVRPGFEDAFLAFVNTGDMDAIPPAPYLEIGKEFQASAKTNYPGIQAANPVENFRPLLSWKQQQTWDRMQLMIRLLEVYHRINGRYPSTENGEDLTVLRDFFPFKDPWGHDYVYNFPGQHETGKYDLMSYGADGQPGGDRINADITNWDPAFLKKYPEQVQASRDIELIALLLEEYRKVHGSFPTTEEALSKLRELIPLKDLWGNDYVYRCLGQHLDYDMVSHGANGEPGGKGEDADITNWAEASLIGQWYEYTPTSALDITFDETLKKI